MPAKGPALTRFPRHAASPGRPGKLQGSAARPPRNTPRQRRPYGLMPSRRRPQSLRPNDPECRGVITLARTDLVLLPPAQVAARAAFEASVRAAWLVHAADPFERENGPEAEGRSVQRLRATPAPKYRAGDSPGGAWRPWPGYARAPASSTARRCRREPPAAGAA